MRAYKKAHCPGGPTAVMVALLLLYPLFCATSNAAAAEPVLIADPGVWSGVGRSWSLAFTGP